MLKRRVLQAFGKDVPMSEVYVLDHPLIQNKLTRMRRKETNSRDFRTLLK